MKKSGLLFILIYLQIIAIAQTGVIKGYVFEKTNGEPSIFTPVVLKGTLTGTTTDVNGFFILPKVKPGTYTLISSTLGFDTAEVKVTVIANETVNEKIFLKKVSRELGVVEISAARQQKTTEVRTSVQQVTPKQIKQLASVGGEPDIAQYLQVLPGVTFTGDQGGQLYIRGGAPIQNKVLLDGMTVYNPFHSIGFFSVFETDIIKNADVYSGGFAAQFGGRVSSIMDISTRDGNKVKYNGKIGVNTFGAKALIEGPLKKQNEDGSGGASSILISAKTSYLDKTSKSLYGYRFSQENSSALGIGKLVGDTNGLPFGFNDFYAKVTSNSGDGSKLSLFGFSFNDRVSYDIAKVNWGNNGIGFNTVVAPKGTNVLLKLNLGYSKYKIKYAQSESDIRESSIGGVNIGFNLVQGYEHSELSYGVEIVNNSTKFNFKNAVGQNISNDNSSFELGPYIKYRYNSKNGKLIIDPSLRLQYYANLSEASIEPRLGMKYNATKGLRFKLSTGRYSQNLIAGNSDRDVVNLFYGFITGPDNIPNTLTNQNGSVTTYKSKLQKANHYIFGTEIDLGKYFELNVEGYIKTLGPLSNINRDKIFQSSETTRPAYLRTDYILETGISNGVDLVLKYDYKRFYIWTTYSFGYNKRWDGRNSYFPIYDRRHNINVVTSYTFGKGLKWQLDGRWNLGSGFPFVPISAQYNQLNASNYNTNPLSNGGNLGTQFAPITETNRQPYFHRFDVSAKRTFAFNNDTKLETNVSITNVYNRQNLFYYDATRRLRVDQLPILFSIGATFSF